MAGTTIDIDGNSKGFKNAAKDVNKSFKKISKGAEKSASKGTSAFKVFLGTFSAMALKSAFSAALNGFRSLNRFVGESIELSQIQEDAVNDLESALKRTGKFTQEVSDDFQAYASSLQETSRFGDEVILQNAALIQSFGNLSEDGLKTATASALDLAAGIGVDLKTASNLLGRAASGNVGILSRYGLAIESTGDKAQDFQLVLDKISDSFGGAAQQQVQTFAGQTDQLSNSFGDLQEKIGDIFTSNDEIIGSLGILKDSFNELGQFIVDNKDELQSLATDGFAIVVQSSSFLIQSIASISSAFLSARESYLKFANAQEIERLEEKLSNLPDQIDINGQKVETFYERGLRKRIETLKGERDSESESYQNRLSLIEEFQDKIQGFEERILAKKKEGNNQEVEAEKEKFSKINEVRAEQRAKEAEIRELEKERELNEQELERTKEFEKLNYIRDILGQEEAFKIESRARELAAEGKHDAAKAKLREAQIKAEKADMMQLRKWEDLSQKEKVANFKSTMGTIASLQSSSSAELFAIGKAAALAQATIDGFAAVQVALRSAPPPFNFALAATVGAATAANISKIASQPKPTGAFNGAVVEGGSMTRDTEPFMLSKGEIVAPRKSFDEVVEGTARQRGFVKGDGGESKNINISIDTFIGQDEFINDVIDQIREKILFENADLGVA